MRIQRDLVYRPKVIKKPKGKRILVLAPHFDDATLGCGGTLYKHALAGDKFFTVYMTDGGSISELRKSEARCAMKMLRAEDIYFLNEPEGVKKIKKPSVEKLCKIIKRINPDIIYLPSFLENHVDHIKINYLLYSAAKKLKLNVNVCAYEVWTPLIPNILVDISDVVEIKKKAIHCFKSQILDVDCLSTILGLNRYRSIYNLKGRKYAEAFFFTNIKSYFRLFFGGH